MATTPPADPPRASDPRDEAFFREVDDEFRRDRLNRLARRYGRWVLLGIGIGLAALGGWLFWRAEQIRRAEALSEQFSQALDKVEAGAAAEAGAALKRVAASDSAAYRALAVLTEAGMAAKAGRAKDAAAGYRAVAADGRAPAALRDAARVKLVQLEYDSMQPAAIVAALRPFTEGDSPWFPVAGEMAAVAHLRAGEPAKAAPLFVRIARDQRTPPTIRARAEQMAAMLGQEVTAEPAAAAKGAK